MQLNERRLSRELQMAHRMGEVWQTVPFNWQCIVAMTCGYLTRAEVEMLADLKEGSQEMMVELIIKGWASEQREKLRNKLASTNSSDSGK